MKKHALIILSLSAALLSGCATSKQVQAMIDENNLRYDAEIERLKANQQAMQTQMTTARDKWTDTIEKLEKIRINTKALEEARQNLLNYCRQHSAVLGRFIQSMETMPITQPQPAPVQAQPSPVATNVVTPPTNPTPVTPMTTPEPVY